MQPFAALKEAHTEQFKCAPVPPASADWLLSANITGAAANPARISFRRAMPAETAATKVELGASSSNLLDMAHHLFEQSTLIAFDYNIVGMSNMLIEQSKQLLGQYKKINLSF
jgi:hypothetical protein